MKIVRLSTFLNFGGVEKRLMNVSHHDDNSFEHVFVAIGHGGTAEEEIRRNGKRVECLGLVHKIPSLRTIVKLYGFLKREKPAVIHTSGAEANFHGMIAAWLAGVPVRIAEEIGIPHQHYLAKKIFKYIYVLSDAVIANATLVLDYLREQNQVKQRKIRLVYNPVLFKNEMETGKRTKDLFTIVSISRLTPIKNIEKLIGIFPRLLKHFPQIRYNIVGDGPSRKALTKQVQELGLENYVTFKGFQSNITSFLEEADLYVLPSFSEGFPNALVEAMYNGLPCVATKIGGASEIIEDGTNGYLIDPHDSGHIYTILERMILMPEDELAAMGQRAKQHVLDSYSLERHMESLFSIYKMYLNS